MDEIEQLIDRFADHVGFKNLKLNKNGAILIQFKESGDFYIERTPENGLRLSFVKQHHYPSTKTYLRALELVNFNQIHQQSRLYYAGLAGPDKFVFATVLSPNQLILSEIMTSMEWLMKMHELLGQ